MNLSKSKLSCIFLIVLTLFLATFMAENAIAQQGAGIRSGIGDCGAPVNSSEAWVGQTVLFQTAKILDLGVEYHWFIDTVPSGTILADGYVTPLAYTGNPANKEFCFPSHTIELGDPLGNYKIGIYGLSSTDNIKIVAAPASYTVTKNVDQGSISTPGTLNYTITVENTGDLALTNPIIADTLPDGSNATLIGPTGDNGNGQLDIGETWTYSTSYEVTQDDINAGDNLVNTVAVDFDEASGVTASATTTISAVTDFSVSKTVDKGSIDAPGALHYTITVSNNGTVTLENPSVIDTLPDGTQVAVNVIVSGDDDDDGELDPGETWEYNVSYYVDQDDIDAGDNLTNQVDVSFDGGDKVSAFAATTISQSPAFSVSKSSDRDWVNSPTTLTYTIRVQNTGNISLTEISISDPLVGPLSDPSGDAGTPNVLDVGETWQYTVDFDVTQAIIDGNGVDMYGVIDNDGDIDNTVTVDFAETDPPQTASKTVSITSPNRQSIPTLSEWGMIIMSLLLAGSAVWMIRRRQMV